MEKQSADTMINDRFEAFHIKDIVEENNTLYHYHSFYEIHCTLKGSGLYRWRRIPSRTWYDHLDSSKRLASNRPSNF